MTKTINTLPNQETVKNALSSVILKRFTKRNNQYIITVSLSDYLAACKIAETFGAASTIAKQQWVKVNIS